MTDDNGAGAQPPPGGLKALSDRASRNQALYGDDDRDDPRSAVGLPPVTAIARAALDAALPADVRARLANDEPLAIVVSVPGPDWIDEIRMAVASITDTAHYFVRDGSARKDHVPTKGNLDVGQWLAGGGPVIGISHSPATFLPAALLSAADATLDVRTPDGATLARILALTGRAPPPDIPDSACLGASFAEILSAFREGVDGRGVVDALARMSARRAGVHDDDGVPPLPLLPGFSGPARDWGLALIDAFRAWKDDPDAHPWKNLSASAVITGNPGVGKTYFARSLAKGLGVPIVATSVGDWFARTEGNLGDVAKAFQDNWDRAMSMRPSLLYIDELDALPSRDSLSARHRDWWLPIISQVLTQTDGAQNRRDGLILLGTTNYGSNLDKALIRRGRFGPLIQANSPSPTDLAEVAAYWLDGVLSTSDLLPAVGLSRGASSADAAAWAREARSVAAAAGRPVSVADVANAIAPPDDRSSDVLRRCAVHEAGHAIVGRSLGKRVAFATIVQVGDSGGATGTLSDVDLTTMADINLTATVGLGGRAAEQTILAAPSGGAVGDLAKVSALVAMAHASLGLGDSLVHRCSGDEAVALLNVDAALRRTVEEHVGRLYADALAIVRTERDAVLRVADALVQRRHLTGADIDVLARSDRHGGAP